MESSGLGMLTETRVHGTAIQEQRASGGEATPSPPARGNMNSVRSIKLKEKEKLSEFKSCH